ncbi:MAG: HAMP domain-containing histidine kinase [Anaerolineales bacterium]|nr:HAMP domain-containing histidine kinase [Anaerolineales bacterium]
MALALRDTTQEYEQQQQLESHYRRRIDTLSHELNAPVATIRLQLRHMANSDGGDGASHRQALQVAQSETERLIRLVANLLALSRLELSQTPQRRLTKLNGLVEEAMAQLIEPANARQVSLELEADPNLPRVPLDDEAWRQVFFEPD